MSSAARVLKKAEKRLLTRAARKCIRSRDRNEATWGQRFGAAAELYVTAGSTGDLVAGPLKHLVFNGALNSIFQQLPGAQTRSAPAAKGSPAA